MNNSYFPHDFNARNDENILKMFKNEGLESVSVFWFLIEMLYEAGGWLKLDYEDLCFNMRLQKDKIPLIKKVINNYGLFDKKENQFTSPRVLETLQYIKEKSKKAKKSAEIRWGKNTKAMPTHSEGNAIKLNETKLNEIKEKESIIKKENITKIKYLNFVLLTKEELKKLIAKYGEDNTNDLIHRLNNYIGSKGRKYKSHYFTLLNWASKDKMEIVQDEFKDPRSEAEKKAEAEFNKLPITEQEKRRIEGQRIYEETIKSGLKKQ